MRNSVIKCFALLVLLSVVNTCYAIGDGAYLGIDFGYSNLNNKARAVPAPNGFVVKPNNTGLAGRLFIGDVMAQYFGFEFGLTHYASSTYNAPTGDTGNVHTSAFDLEVVPRYFIPKIGLSVFGKVGFAYLRSVQSRKLTLPNQSANNSGMHPLIGFGLAYDATQSWVIDLGWTRVVSRSNALPSPNFISIGISYHITDHYCGQFLC